MGTRKIDLHPDDELATTAIRQQLRQARKEANESGYGLSAKLGRSKEFITNLERGVNGSPRLSTLQLWAGGLDLRIEFELTGFWMFAHTSGEMTAWYGMSRLWGADKDQRMWLVSALRTWRIRKGLDVEEVAPLMQIDGDTLRRWESESHDPLLARAMLQARVTGTVITMSLWRKEDWVFA